MAATEVLQEKTEVTIDHLEMKTEVASKGVKTAVTTALIKTDT